MSQEVAKKTTQNHAQFVVFKLGENDYGIDITKVITIEKVLPIARVPKTPSFIKGVINLRGEIVPVMDVRKRFGMDVTEETDETRIIILKVQDIQFGVIVDEVDEVLTLEQEDIENVSNTKSDITMEYVAGVGKLDQRFVILLYPDKLSDMNM
jgi:purine-binding chemotaxis protein CheW